MPELNDFQQLALLIDAVEDYAIFLLGPSGEIRSWNRGAARIMGYDAGEVIGKHFSTFYRDEDRNARKPEFELETAAAHGRIEDEGWRIRKDGRLFWANTVITALRSPGGELTGFAKITRDLTDRREAEEHLRRNEEQVRLLVDSVKEYAIFLLDADGRVLTWNVGAERLKGYTRDEIIGQHFSVFFPEDDVRSGKPERELEAARTTGSAEDEGWRVRKDGTRFWANVVITAVRDERGRLRGFAKVTRDMTERKRAEEMQRVLLQQREARLQAEEERRRAEAAYRIAYEANRAKDAFLMTLSHELRTPMTAILGWSRLLPNLSPQDASFQDAVNAIGRSAQVQARLIDDVLDVSRIVSGKLRLNVRPVEVLHLLQESVEAVRASAEARMITLTTSFAPALGTIPADATRIQQIVWNLLTNAVKFTPAHGEVTLCASRRDSEVVISVRDTGEGIDSSFLPHVFEAFRQSESPATRVHGGLGLGLAIVRHLVEAHGGTITAESEGPGTGATFTVRLPAPADHQSAGAEEARPRVLAEDARRLNGARILLVDDDTDGRQALRTAMRQAGADVTDVESAADALKALGSSKPDLVVTDIAMPVVDGYALAAQIRTRDPHQKIVALSAFNVSDANRADAAFDAYISKPVDPDELIDRIREVIRR